LGLGLAITCSYQIVVDEKRAKIRDSRQKAESRKQRQSDQPAERNAV